MPTRCNRGFYCRFYCLLNMFRAPLCPSSGAQEYYTVVAACGISCCGFSSSWSGVELRVMCPVLSWLHRPLGPRPPLWCSAITLRRIKIGRTPLDEWSASRRDLYLKIHNTDKRHTHAPGGIRTRNSSKRTTVEPRLRPRGYWDRLQNDYSRVIFRPT